MSLMSTVSRISCAVLFALFFNGAQAQIVINEGSNKNYSTLADENLDFPDWIELYNAGTDSVDLFNYALTDNVALPAKWTFPHVQIQAGGYKTIFCSGKDRKPITGFINVANSGTFSPTVGWNTHSFSTPIYWDGVSNILINVCSYSSLGYITNSVFNQTATSFPSTVYAFQDGSPASCYSAYGTPANLRPNMQINGVTIGTGAVQNCNTCYPAPYGNWYWGARHQMLVRASELAAAGLSAGPISSLAFDVASTDTVAYDYIEISMKLVTEDQISSEFQAVDPNNFLHTNFKISGTGETVFLFSPALVLQDSLPVNCVNLDNSVGSFPDSSSNTVLFASPTPSASNNASIAYTSYLSAPAFSVTSGFYELPFTVSIVDSNGGSSSVRYTLDGSDPNDSSALYSGTPLQISFTTVVRAKAFQAGVLPSPVVSASYFMGVEHATPVLSVITDNTNLFGPSGIFDNWWTDQKRAAYAEYFDSTYQLVFSQPAGMQVDGGAGGSRSQPQHSFRLEMTNGVLGGDPVDYALIPDRPGRTRYSNIYLRNGSNQYLTLPYKDAAQVKMMCKETNNYYSAWRPVSVYLNGSYFGLYEMREKWDAEYFKTLENANPDSTSILSLSFWYGSTLRALQGSTDTFWNNYNSFAALNATDTSFWNDADRYFDMTYYQDYVIGQSWMGNVDWPGNNIKLYRSDKTNYRWRFCIIDQELAMAPNGWTDCYVDHINYLLSQDPNNPFIGVWLKGMQNERFKNYFINRFADLMNTSYKYDRLAAIENNMFSRTVFEMQNEFERWGDPANVPAQMSSFVNNHMVFMDQLSQRTAVVRDNILTNFTLPQQVDVTLDAMPSYAGKIHISTITPDDYPWQGVYFDGVPVKIEAIANPGYYFTHWGNNALLGDTLNPVFLDTLALSAVNFTAYFDAFVSVPSLTNATSDFSIYPNPTTNNLFLVNNGINSYSDATYDISDLNGKIILAGILPNADTRLALDIRSLAPSAYVLRIRSSQHAPQQFRFVKAND